MLSDEGSKLEVLNVGRGGVVVRTSDFQHREPGSNPPAAVSKLGQFRSRHVASVHPAE